MKKRYGQIAAIPLFLLLAPLDNMIYLTLIILMSVTGVYICGKAAKDAGVHDHGAIVWDEFVGLLITMFLMPVTWQTILVGFALFRFFDILKPWPISYLDKNCHGGLGIMLDDIVAGIAAWVCMMLIFY